MLDGLNSWKYLEKKKISNQIDEEKCDAMMSTGDYNG